MLDLVERVSVTGPRIKVVPALVLRRYAPDLEETFAPDIALLGGLIGRDLSAEWLGR